MLGLSLVLAYALDLLLGDPVYRLHPIRLMGQMARLYETKLRELVRDEVRSGFLLALGLPMDVLILTVLVLWGAGTVHGVLQFAISTFLIYSALSVKDMDDHARRVEGALARGDLEGARSFLSSMVGRDTAGLNEKEVVRATVETVAEGTLDGILSPFFYAGVGGAPLAMFFKAVSTLDSTVGYRNERYERLGRYSAHLDGMMNYIPARVAPVVVSLGAVLSGYDGWAALRTGYRDGSLSPSPNSGYPEASFAGALGVRMGGVNYYDGKPAPQPLLNGEGREATVSDIAKSIRLMYFSSFFALLMSLAIWYTIFSLANAVALSA